MKGFMVTSSVGTSLGYDKQRAGIGAYFGSKELSISFGQQKRGVKELSEIHEGLVAITMVFDSVENAKKAIGDDVRGVTVEICDKDEKPEAVGITPAFPVNTNPLQTCSGDKNDE